MNTINNPLVLKNYPEIGDESMYVPANTSPGEYVSKALAVEMLEALEDYRDFLITGVSGVSSEEICELILKAKGE